MDRLDEADFERVRTRSVYSEEGDPCTLSESVSEGRAVSA
jgi:hypothetical protein